MQTSRTEWIELWNGQRWPGQMVDGLPAFEFKCAPSGLLTRRQLRDRGLCRDGREPFARLVWRGGRRWAWLYVADFAKPKRVSSPAQLEAIAKATAARRVCAECGPVDHCVRTRDRLCGDCVAAGVEPVRVGPAPWQVVNWEEVA
jgi:hypothetical protein